MDALIMSCGTGGGHDAAAKALEEEMLRRGHNVRRINPYMLKSERLAHAIDQSYIRLVQRAPKVFGAVYWIGSMYRNLPFHSPVFALNGKMIPSMKHYLSENHFDMILMTHFFPGEILTNMKQQGLPVPKSILVATDYACIPFTEEVDADAYVIPAPNLIDEFARRRIPTDRLYPYGIPVSQCFSAQCSKRQIRKRLGLEADKRYFLIAGGSMGAGKLSKVLKTLTEHYHDDESVRFIVLCGRNKRVYDHLKVQYGKHALIMMHTNQMADYLRACDLYLSKPGGLSTTEAAVAGIPLIHITPIPGCETRNAKFFDSCGMSRFVKSPSHELISAVEELLTPEAISAMKTAQAKWINRQAASDICDLAESLCKDKE